MNYFAFPTAAERYARNRPYFHPLVIDKIRMFLQLQTPLAHALDVGCGTGQSTFALKAIAAQVVGVDMSEEMLAFARSAHADPDITYIQAPAEDLPLPDNSVDLITVSLAFHWFDRTRFLAEAQRLLRPGGWLVIYNNAFPGILRENPAFEAWSRERYLARYPNPPRNNQPFTDVDAEQSGFRFVRREHYTNDVVFTVEDLANYLMTQSNIIAAVEQGAEPVEHVYAWLRQELAPLFVGDKGTFIFGGHIWYLQ